MLDSVECEGYKCVDSVECEGVWTLTPTSLILTKAILLPKVWQSLRFAGVYFTRETLSVLRQVPVHRQPTTSEDIKHKTHHEIYAKYTLHFVVILIRSL